MIEFAVADELKVACSHCATIARAKIACLFVPEPSDPTGTLTFIAFEGRAYAVTAGHVIDIFREAAIAEGTDPEGYFLPVAPGLFVHPPFVRPPASWTAPTPDIALRPIPNELPARIGKQAFELRPKPMPAFPIPFALAVGFPTKSKSVQVDTDGTRIALPCVEAVAEGVGSSPESDQVQFFSKLPSRPTIGSLSGLSGGPAFWQ